MWLHTVIRLRSIESQPASSYRLYMVSCFDNGMALALTVQEGEKIVACATKFLTSSPLTALVKRVISIIKRAQRLSAYAISFRELMATI